MTPATQERCKKGRTEVPRTLFALLVATLYLALPAAGAEDYSINPPQVQASLKLGTYSEALIEFTNARSQPLTLSFSAEGEVKPFLKLDKQSLAVPPNFNGNLKVTLLADQMGSYSGFVVVSGDIDARIPVNLSVAALESAPVEALLLEIEPFSEKVRTGGKYRYKVKVQNLLSSSRAYNVTLSYSVDRIGGASTYTLNKSFFRETETVELATVYTTIKEFQVPKFVRFGDYVLNVEAQFFGLNSSASAQFSIEESFLDYAVLGVLPLRWVLLFALIAGIGGTAFFVIYMKRMADKKRYKSKLDLGTLPKPGPRSAYLGKIAETNTKAYFDMDQLQLHTLVAGSTGGGKSVSAKVVVEEALLKGAAAVVFDPTAQWTGFLRKNQDKKMLNLYAQFGMKKEEARYFNGNIRQILDAREIIDVKKYINPGEITVFAVNRLDPQDVDILVTNTIRSVFHANLQESPELKLIVVFDEVHRLLPKFGGSGAGFIQVERAVREFRKWGVGLILISQVLTDFVGETKANINTEIQMRTRDQGDLDRIKEKYGGYMLQSLLKAATGTGMIENAAYNRGDPYFVAFRPLLHEHARLPDSELENYNKYNDVIDDLEYQLEQLEAEKIDVFDLKLELKLAKDKVKSGSFNMVNIYLEGLTPRVQKQWEKLGKQPAKRVTRMVTEEELQQEVEKAKAARKKEEEEQKKKAAALQAQQAQGGQQAGQAVVATAAGSGAATAAQPAPATVPAAAPAAPQQPK